MKVRRVAGRWLGGVGGVVCQVTVGDFSINPTHNLSLALTQCCDCLNPTVKNVNNFGVISLDVILQDWMFLLKRKQDVV